MSKEPVVSLEAVRCSAGGGFELRVDHLSIDAGERVAVVGHNGAGKSTLFRLLSGFCASQEGRVGVLQRQLHATLSAAEMKRLRCELGQVMQGLHLVQRLTVLENVLIGCLGRVHGWRSWARIYPAHEIDAASQALRGVGLASSSLARTDRLSGGERQKVAIARLLLQRPRLILADEPTAALDPASAREICQLIGQAASGSTLISIVHNPALLPLLADRVIGLKRGRIAFDLPIHAVDAGCLDDLYRLDRPGARAAQPAPNPAGTNTVLRCAA